MGVLSSHQVKIIDIINRHHMCIKFIFLFQELIKKNSFWNEEIGEWELRCVAYTGNNMAKELPNDEEITFEVCDYNYLLFCLDCIVLLLESGFKEYSKMKNAFST